MDVKIEKGIMVITLPVIKDGNISDKGNRTIATSHGNQAIVIDGKIVKVGVNAFTKDSK